MACTTILVGKHASYDGSTMIARNDDSGSGHFTPKKFVVIHPEDQKRIYRSVLSHVEVELPEHPYRFTAVPNAVAGKGIWAASGVNEKNVAMTATETITSNPRVLGADPLVEYQPAEDGKEEVPGGIGEEEDLFPGLVKLAQSLLYSMGRLNAESVKLHFSFSLPLKSMLLEARLTHFLLIPNSMACLHRCGVQCANLRHTGGAVTGYADIPHIRQLYRVGVKGIAPHMVISKVQIIPMIGISGAYG